MKKFFFFIWLQAVLLLLFSTGYTEKKDPAENTKYFFTDNPLEFTFRYHVYSELTEILRRLASEYPHLCELHSIGKSATGKRDIWCVEVQNREIGVSLEKPAVYFDGNQHDIEVIGGEAALFLAYHLLSNYGKDPDVTTLVDTRVIYIIPRADPDGAEAFLTGRIDWDPAEVPGKKDVDEDGKFGEDGPEDIDGDGEILKMRIRDPDGKWACYSREPRIMVRREDHHKRPFFRLMDEGVDNDNDGKVNEDPPRTRFISNRNYPAFWSSEDGCLRGAGDYPLQEHNSKILADFILSKPHISQVESYHSTSGIFVRPLGPLPDSSIPKQDLQDYTAVLSKGTEMTDYPTASLYHDFTDLNPGIPPQKQTNARRGVFIDWTYWHRGLFSVTTELWTMEPFVNAVGWGDIPHENRLHKIPGRYRRPDVQTAVLNWLDRHQDDPKLAGQGYKDWKSFDHPSLGKVELGGFTKFWLFNVPPGPFFRGVVEDQARFAVCRALLTPLVKIHSIDIQPDPNHPRYWTLKATAVNVGYFDTSMEQGRKTGIAQPDRLILRLPEGAVTDDPPVIFFSFMRGTRGGSYHSHYSRTWHIQAHSGKELFVEIHSEKGGIDREKVVLVKK